ncbi:MAG TPA: class I SAM-dependent methyltransferase [Actinomadura sp.]|nr:class I SAM-dependent methyltransferase [Actinomadura sp.]
MADKAKVHLEGVPETQLWTLYQRAAEAARPDPVLQDPKAVRLIESIDYPFEERFGTRAFGQWQGLRARCFDEEIRRFLAAHPDGTVVALGEGLETQFWRVDNGRVRWLTVDLPESVELRERLLPADPPRRRVLACSALDPRWMDEVDSSSGVLITAQGLLMYLPPAEVRGLIAACARRFPGGALVFDAIPRWFSALSKRGLIRTDGYEAPPMPWALDPGERRRIAALHPTITELGRLTPPRGHGPVHAALMPLLNRMPVIRDRLMSIVIARFGR